MLRRLLASFVLVLFAILPALAQTNARSNAEPAATGSASSTPKTVAIDPKYTTPKSPLDTAYGAKIAEYTTEKYFLTELVDHLPASDKVPSPDKVLGYAIGTPNKLTYTKDLYRYYRQLAAASPRVRVFVAPEKSEEGREQMLVLVSDEANLAKLDRYKEITAKLADPRKAHGLRCASIDRRRQTVLLGFRIDSFTRNRLARDVDGDGLPARG
jgi:hypothetical protein